MMPVTLITMHLDDTYVKYRVNTSHLHHHPHPHRLLPLVAAASPFAADAQGSLDVDPCS